MGWFFWQIPNEARKAPGYERPQTKLESLLSKSGVNEKFLVTPGTSLSSSNLSTSIHSSYDFKFVLLGSDPDGVGNFGPGFYLGLGRTKIFR